MSDSAGSKGKSRSAQFLAALAVLAVVLSFLFHKSFTPELVLFSNDAPLGLIQAEAGQQATKEFWTGFWNDLNWIGIEQPAIAPGPSLWTYWLMSIFGEERAPVLNAKFYAPISLLFLGLSAWLFFRQLGFRNAVCVLGGIAAALNMNTFSHVCWGLPTRAMSQAAIFLALAALQSGSVRHFWMKAVLAGIAVGLAIIEGFDVGALYSLYVAAFAIFLVMTSSGPTPAKLTKSFALVAAVAICAAWCAAYTLTALVGTQIKNVAGSQQDEMTRQERWDNATWWSLPKVETLRVMIPGLFGYRMDTEGGGNYWGRVGEQPGLPRHSGAGEYAGILVVLVGAWGTANGFRKKNGPFTDKERYQVIFWTFAAIISVLYAWGRHAPFYKIIYWLPYFSTIRNPIKFMHFFHLSLLILFAFGLEGLYRMYISQATAAKENWIGAIKSWWKSAGAFDRKWVFALGGAGALAAIGYMIYLSSNSDLENHLRTAGFPGTLASEMARFSYKEMGLFLAFFAMSVFALLLVQSRFLSGSRTKTATLVLGAILVLDLARANLPWIIYYNYKERYASSPLFDALAEDAHERRITSKWYPLAGGYLIQNPELSWFPNLQNSWLQNQYQFHDILSLEVIQFPRIPVLDETFLQALFPTNQSDIGTAVRLWQLTSTRLLIGQRGYEDALNRLGLTGTNAFRLETPFAIVPRGSGNQQQLGADDVTTELSPNGPFAVIEFTGALPRVKLFTQWEVEPDDQRVLARLRDWSFNAAERVLISDQVAAPATNENATATASFENYGPKEFTVKTESSAPGILMVTDKYSPNWKVFVDGKEDRLLRANYIMRGVHLPPGSHTVEFRYRPDVTSLYVTLTAILAGLGLCGFLAFRARRAEVH